MIKYIKSCIFRNFDNLFIALVTVPLALLLLVYTYYARKWELYWLNYWDKMEENRPYVYYPLQISIVALYVGLVVKYSGGNRGGVETRRAERTDRTCFAV
jgi:hypothetical protein